MPKNASKNRVFASFFAKNGQNLHFFTQKMAKKGRKINHAQRFLPLTKG